MPTLEWWYPGVCGLLRVIIGSRRLLLVYHPILHEARPSATSFAFMLTPGTRYPSYITMVTSYLYMHTRCFGCRAHRLLYQTQEGHLPC